MFPAETKWALKALSDARDRLDGSQDTLIKDETWALNPQAMFAGAAEALMWIVLLDDWYRRKSPDQYARLKVPMATLVKGLRWARNLAIHDFALITGFTERYEPGDDRIHPGWQARSVLPDPGPRFDRGSKAYDARIKGRPIVDPIDEVAAWFNGAVEPAIVPIEQR